MFTAFFYLLRDKGLHVSLNEWMSLMEALDKGLCGASLTDFYRFCKAVLVKSEVDYDRFDLAFAEYFQGVKTPDDIPDQIWKWLDKNLPEKEFDTKKKFQQYSVDKLRELFEKKLEEQKEEHNGGSYWIGTGGVTPWGHSGYHPGGLRIGGESRRKSALQVAGERRFRDFRQDTTMDVRQFQMAFRKLRQFSSRIDSAKTELDIDGTIKETCNNAGNLKLAWERPRINTMKVLLLMDSDGSMWPYSQLCNRLFQAAHKSNHFKDFQVYYFHNCIYDHLYLDPSCTRNQWIDTASLLKNLDSDYRVIIVGDASMAPGELLSTGGNIYWDLYNEMPGIEWLYQIQKKYDHTIWLNPIKKINWPYTRGSFTINRISEIFPMFELTLDGFDSGIKKLKASR